MLTSRSRTLTGALSVATLVALAACGGEASESAEDAQQPMAQEAASAMDEATVTIAEPAQGAEVQGPNVTVHLTAEGVEIVPAGELVPGTGHHHLYLDRDLGAPGVPVPSEPGHVIHLGTGVSEYTFEGVEPGEHRLIAVVADGIHVPLTPWVVDTVTFTVR